MKKVFFFLFIIYLVPAITGNMEWQYFEKTKATEYLYKHWYFILLSAVLVFVLFFLLAKRSFKILGDAQYKKFFSFAYIVFFAVVLIVNSSYISFINNNTGSQKKLTISGTVTKKYKNFKRKKEDSRSIEITEALTGKKYLFRVRTSAYLSLKEGEPFSKEFQIGSLGILFRREK
jgi:hypothetical protein